MNFKPKWTYIFISLSLITCLVTAIIFYKLPSIISKKSNTEHIMANFGKLPLSFEANLGQTNEKVNFISRGSNYSLFLTPSEAVLSLYHRSNETSDKAHDKASVMASILRMQLLGANSSPQIKGLEKLPGGVNYIIGNDQNKWQRDVGRYSKVLYEGIYPGVDLLYYGNQGRLEYDFILEPGASPKVIALKFAGVDVLDLNNQGELVLKVSGGEVRMHKPLVYQKIDGVQKKVSGDYVRTGPQQIGFNVGEYNPNYPLVIDPVLVYSTYLGGSGSDAGNGIAVDSSGNVYIMGTTTSSNFPTTEGVLDSTYNGSVKSPLDIFITKLNSTGTEIMFSTYLGGTGYEFNMPYGNSIAVDSTGHAYVTAYTASNDFPVTPGAIDKNYNGSLDVVIAKLNALGTELIYSTYLGSIGSDESISIAIDTTGNAYVTGRTTSSEYPTTLGAFDITYGGSYDAFITKINSTGTALVYSTFLGSGGSDQGNGIIVDGDGNAYVTGSTYSSNFPTTVGAFAPSFNDSGEEAFVTKLNSTGSALEYSTYLGGNDSDSDGDEELGVTVDGDQGLSIAVDVEGNAYVTGLTVSTDFPTTFDAIDRSYNGNIDSFVTKLNPSGSTLAYSTYLGGNRLDQGLGIVVDGEGNAYVTGPTVSHNFPTSTDAIDSSFNGSEDIFITKLSSTGTIMEFSSYLLGDIDVDRSVDLGLSIALDGLFNVYITGLTVSSYYPTTAGAYDTTFNGNTDAFVIKLSIDAALTPTPKLNNAPLIQITQDQGDLYEGEQYIVNGTFADLDSSSWSGKVSYGDGTHIQELNLNSGNTFSLSHVYKDNGSYGVLVTITDNQGATGSKLMEVIVENSSPIITSITGPVSPIRINETFQIDAVFSDRGILDIHSAVWNWGDGSSSTGSLMESNGSGNVVGTHKYNQAGDYTIKLTVTDNQGASGENTAVITVYAVPTDKAQCKKDGWRDFSFLNFKNQGDCVSYVATKGKNPPSGN